MQFDTLETDFTVQEISQALEEYAVRFVNETYKRFTFHQRSMGLKKVYRGCGELLVSLGDSDICMLTPFSFFFLTPFTSYRFFLFFFCCCWLKLTRISFVSNFILGIYDYIMDSSLASYKSEGPSCVSRQLAGDAAGC